MTVFTHLQCTSPLIVDEALMVEPTETESKETLDDAIAVFRKLYKLAETDPEKLYQAPVTTPVTRLDEVKCGKTSASEVCVLRKSEERNSYGHKAYIYRKRSGEPI